MKKPFRRAFIEITNNCGLACAFCAQSARAKEHMSLELFESAARQAGELAGVISLHLLGEPLTHPDFPAIISTCSRLGLKVNLVTNGLLLRGVRQQLYGENCLSQVSVSLHALSGLPPSDRDAALQELVSFAAGKPRGLTLGFRLRAASRDRSFERTLEALLAAFKARPEPGKNYIRLADGVFLNFGGIFNWPGGAGEGGKKSCLGLRHHFGILSDGRVVPCCADFDGALALGDIKKNSLDLILNSPAARALRGALAGNAPMPPYCSSCGFSSFDS